MSGNDELLRDRQQMWRQFSHKSTWIAVVIAISLALMGIFLV
jgi:hypothetical protein